VGDGDGRWEMGVGRWELGAEIRTSEIGRPKSVGGNAADTAASTTRQMGAEARNQQLGG
jgi:hypothetical protein